MITGRRPVSPTASGGPGMCMKQSNWLACPQSTNLKECLDSDPRCVLLLYTISLIMSCDCEVHSGCFIY